MKKKIFFALIIILGFIIVGSFTNKPQKILDFTKNPSDHAVIAAGLKGTPTFVFDPAVIVDSEGYHLFFTTIFCKKGSDYYYSYNPSHPNDCNILDKIATTAYGFSADRGLTWQYRSQPVILPSKGWDNGDIETPNVVRVGDKLYLFYSGLKAPKDLRYQIGVATLDIAGGSIKNSLLNSNKEFVRISSNSLIASETASQAFNNNVQEPTVVYKNGKFELFFLGLGFKLPDKPVNYDGQEIKSIGLYRYIYDAQLNLLERSDKILDSVNIQEVRWIDNLYYLFSSTRGGGDFHNNEKIEYRTSEDGLKWSKPRLVIEKGQTGFDNWAVTAPTLVLDGDLVVLFYTTLGLENQQCNPAVRFGKPGVNNQSCIYSGIGRAEAKLENQ